MIEAWTAWLALSLNLLVGAVFLGAAVTKSRRPSEFVNAVRNYELLPRALSVPAAGATVAIELFVAVSLISGWAMYVAFPAAILLLIAFALAVGVNLHKGRIVPCGCFGSARERISFRTLVRIGLLLLAVILSIGLTVSSRARLNAVSLLSEGLGGLGQFALAVAFAAFLFIFGTWLLHAAELAAVFRSRSMDSEGGLG